MKIGHPWRDGLRSASLLVLMLGLWAVFAPTAAGGAASYVIVAGASMEPVLHRGDLVITHIEDEYRVGEIVTYRHPVVGPVIHRIIGQNGGRFLLKGDANTWTDSYDPRPEDILGGAWLRLPGFGDIFQWLRNPLVLGLTALLISMLTVSAMAPDTVERWKPDGRRLWPRIRDAAQNAGLLQGAVFVLGVVAIVSLLLALAAFTHPTSKKVDRGIAYENSGSFSYAASVPLKVYGSESLQTGQPVFLNLTRQVSFRFGYNLVADAVTDAHGTAGLVARVLDTNGWSRSVILQRETPFTGNKASAAGVLNLNSLLGYIHDLESMTGVQRPSYIVSIEPTVHILGTIAGAPLDDHFSPSLTFTLDDFQMQMAQPAPGSAESNPLKPSSKESVAMPELVANRLSILGISLDVAKARWGAAIGLAIGVMLSALLWLAFQRAQREDIAGSIRLRHGMRLVAVRSGDVGGKKRILEVSDMEDLARVAERSGHVILWLQTDAGDEYYVRDGDDTYRYRLPHPVGPSAVKDSSTSRSSQRPAPRARA